MFTGKIVCEEEGHLNPRSCLLEGPAHSRQNKGTCVHLDIPDSVSCSLFPGQVREGREEEGGRKGQIDREGGRE